MNLLKLLSTLLITTVLFQSCGKDDFTVENATMRLPIGAGTNSAAYFTFNNNTDKSIKIVSVASSLDAEVQIHNVSMKEGMMHMHEVEFIEIDSSSSKELKSGSYHVMLLGIKDQLKAEDVVNFTLTLSDQSNVSFEATVKSMDAMKMPAKGHMH